ncbi:MAG TPA: thioredoxin family protein [Bacteroidota bacterium]|jgi:small redox-active disulfide protein 2|nr:thioredoxin family protein [Bacteroidota bacterium]
MTIKILGTGCSKCKKLEDTVREVMQKNNIQGEIIKVTQLDDIMKYGIMMTPGLVINEKVKSYGNIPKEEQILEWLKES